MTEKEKIAFLVQYQEQIKLIKGRAYEIAKWDEIRRGIAQHYSDMPHGSSSNSAKFEKPTDMIADIITQLREEIEQSQMIAGRIKFAIDSMPNSRYRILLTVWYINGMPIDDIVELFKKQNRRSIYKLRKSALRKLEVPDEKEI